ncbi:hypothetical protein IFM89_001408 [Coptis chinensis]|uniref:Ubiquitin carboxyl-terminal hydrolase n=1 Tax=Coptis chinensis TaxID=261450 RepID=A0A835I795_9MAGN|nr:hypothetical protein IFM89_001408 [Coptis chinensis]
MGETLIQTNTSSSASLFQRRIEFHPARKPFTAFINNNNDFHIETLNPTTSDYAQKNLTGSTLLLSNGNNKKKLDFFENELDPELFSFGLTVRRIGAGLQNLGNTCFLNSVLQCLTYTEPFAAYLQSGKHKSSYSKLWSLIKVIGHLVCSVNDIKLNSTQESVESGKANCFQMAVKTIVHFALFLEGHTSGFCAMCAIQNHVKSALQSSGRILAPKDLVMNLRCISRNFRNARQEDAHEYMVNLLESMHKCCLPSGLPSESPSAYEKSLVHKIFGGRLRSQVKCMQCSFCSNTFDPFLDLSLEIVKADSLLKALSHFTAIEQLDGGQRQYQCQRCKQKVKALKQLTVHKAPYVLSVHLKRFGSHRPGQKIDKKIEFSPTLDLKPFVSGSYEDVKYTLYGVLVHDGWSTHSGHYYCFVRTSSGVWHSLNDNRVVQVSEKTVLQQKAYMLFYVRDRSLAPKKPIDGKGNFLPRVVENGQHSASVKLKETVQNGPISTQARTVDCSFTSAKIDGLSSVLSKNPHSKKMSIADNRMGMEESSSALKDPMLLSKELVKGPATKQSTNGPSVLVGCPESTSSSAKRSNMNLGNLVCAPPKCSGLQSSVPEDVIDKAIQKNAVVADRSTPSVAPHKNNNNLMHETSISVRISNKSGTKNNQNEGERAPSEHSGQKPEEHEIALKDVELAEPSIHSRKRNGCFQKEAIGHHGSHQKVLNSKKKLMKPQLASMHLGNKFLLRASLSLHKKKKKKRNKPRCMEIKSHIQDSSDKTMASVNLEPLTSQETRMTGLVSTKSKSQKGNSHAEKGSGWRAAKDSQNSNGESGNNITRLGERNCQINSELLSNEPPQKFSTSSSTEKQWDSRESDSAQVKRGLESGVMSMLTRGLQEFTVARWDEIESSPPREVGSINGQSLAIGYVPDEWDEEYDRGKRKKVRISKDSFDGSNPFQEIATKKGQLKEVNSDRTSSGNQPLRIR